MLMCQRIIQYRLLFPPFFILYIYSKLIVLIFVFAKENDPRTHREVNSTKDNENRALNSLKKGSRK